MPRKLPKLVVALSLISLTEAGSAKGLSRQADEAPSSPDLPRFTADAEVVTLDVVVLDESGDPIEGLTIQDFTITDEGQPRPIARFEAVASSDPSPASRPSALVSSNALVGRAPRRIFFVVFDDVHMDPVAAGPAKAAVRRFVETGLRDGDRVTLVPTSGGGWWHARLPEGRGDLLAALVRLEGLRPRDVSNERMSDWEAMRLHLHHDRQVGAQVSRRYYESRILLEPLCVRGQPCSRVEFQLGEDHPAVRARAAQVYDAASSRRRATYAALRRAAESLEGARGRKTILFISEGFIQESGRPEHRALVEAAQRSNATIHFLDARGLTGPPVTVDAVYGDAIDLRDLGGQLDETTREALGALSVATETGGRVFQNTNDLTAALRRLERESRAYYLLGFEPTDVEPDGSFHRLEVAVDGPGVEVLARRGYFAPTGRPDDEAPDHRVRVALDSPFEVDAVPLRVASYALGPADGKTAVVFAASTDPGSLSFETGGSQLVDSLSVVLVITRRETGERVRREREVAVRLTPAALEQARSAGLPLLIDAPLAAGRHQARLMVRDMGGHAMGTVTHDLDVPAPGSFHISTPILTDVLLPSAPGDGRAGRPLPLARRTFGDDQTLTLVYEVYGARDPAGSGSKVVAGYRVESEGGKVIATQPDTILEAGPMGDRSQRAAIALEGVPAGHYAVVVHAREGGTDRSVEARVAFRVVPRRPGSAAAEAMDPEVDDPELATLLERAGRYVLEYEGRLHGIVAEETCTQRVEAHESSLGIHARERQVTRGDMVFVRLDGDLPWAWFRDVFEVNGHEVRDRDARLERLFLEDHPSAAERARAILDESAAYNLGPLARTINVPVLPLLFLRPENQGRFAFERHEDRRIAGIEGVEVRFAEVARPTIVRREGGRDLPAAGRFWIDPAQGTVLRSEVRFDFILDRGMVSSQASVSVEYRPVPRLAMWVPVEMNERYEDVGRQRLFGPTIVGSSRYSNYRRFNVSVETKVRLPLESPDDNDAP